MKKITLLLVALFIATALFATGATETTEEETFDLIVVAGRNIWNPVGVDEIPWNTKGTFGPEDLLIEDFIAANPNVTIEFIQRDFTQGSMTVDALKASGRWPDLWSDAGAYFRDNMNSRDSIELERYMDVSVYQEDLIAPYTIDGHVYALPMSNVSNGLVINLAMLDEIGYTLPAPEDWTTDEFLVLAEQLKQAGYPATMVMTQQGFISWMQVWLYAFGAELFAPNYTHMTVNTPEAIEAFEFLKLLVERGYAPAFPNEQTDDIGVELFSTGQVWSCMMQNQHSDYWVPEQVKRGVIDEAFEYTFIEFPHAPGHARTPTYGYQSVTNAHRTDNEARNVIVAKLTEIWNGPLHQQQHAVLVGSFPTLKGLEIPQYGQATANSYKALANLVPQIGLFDAGGISAKAREARDVWKIPLQRYMDGAITAQEMLDIVEVEANKILAQ